MKKILQLYNNLSLNVVLCTVLCSVMFSRLPDGLGSTSWVVFAVLACCTWLIYLLDRLLDIRIYPPETSTRHFFHFEYKSAITYLVAILFGVSAALTFFLPTEVFYFGATLGVLIVAYLFILNRYMKKENVQWLKEPFTAIFYTAAVIGVVFVSMPVVYASSWLLSIMFFIVVSQNLLLFSYFEKSINSAAVNSVTYFGLGFTEKINRWAFVLVLIFFAVFFTSEWNYKTVVGLCILAMSLALSLMPIFKEFMLKKERYRWIGDGVFLISCLSLFF